MRSLLGELRGILIELGVVRRMLGENVRYLIELRAVRSLLGEMRRYLDRVGSCKENVRRNAGI